jgi:hypothetical protein
MIISVKYLPQIGKILHTRLRKVMYAEGSAFGAAADTKEQSAVSASSSTSIFKNSLSL